VSRERLPVDEIEFPDSPGRSVTTSWPFHTRSSPVDAQARAVMPTTSGWVVVNARSPVALTALMVPRLSSAYRVPSAQTAAR
jgi:hypothetical protein